MKLLNVFLERLSLVENIVMTKHHDDQNQTSVKPRFHCDGFMNSKYNTTTRKIELFSMN